METTLSRTRSSSNPDLLALLSSSHHQSHKRYHSTTDIPSFTDEPAPLQSVSSLSIYANLSPNESNQEPGTSINHDFTFGSVFNPKPTKNRNKSGHKGVPLFLARGLGIDRVGSELLDVAEIFKGKCPVAIGSGEEHLELDMELKRIVEEQPGNAIALRDYAQFLHQTKGDAKRAEEYYSRAILADPTNGEILAQYAKLIWDRHADMERSLSYFEKAVQVSPDNSHVYAAYAGFLWEFGDEIEGGSHSIVQSESANEELVRDEAPTFKTT
ncbi:Tetratricopeptide repeat (TPR)-like superfamily protein [Rhynchospora pubera]|uniref:Tetratricopeptide repeat (TPR)-like superfamily protein n=1 Tax=Rhynchospora pubera TaxID=906938 RepID=A0AAV8CXD0_9POAL|nr:Tetratricopeptide repeat (TPR)-like superfamily protein [Rhynchospora pubera]